MKTSVLSKSNLFLPAGAYNPRAIKGMEKVDLSSLGIFSDISGSDTDRRQGYNAAGDLVYQTSDGFDLNVLWDEFQAAVAAMNAERQPIIDLLTFPVNDPIERVPQISSVEFEEASEYGEPRGYRPAASYFTLGYGFKFYDLANRFTWKFLADAPASQIEATAAMAMEADNRLVFREVMSALYNSTNRTADIMGQAVNIYALYNADGTVPPQYKSNTFDGTHTHYLTSGAATVVSEDLDDMYEHVRHHGYSMENGVQHVLVVNTAEAKVIRTFRVASGDQYDFIPAAGQPGQFLDTGSVLFGAIQPGNNLGGLTVIGKYGPMIIIEDDLFPASYMSLIGTGGLANLNNPVGFREHSNKSLRGLKLIKGRDDSYPLIDSYYARGFGTGIRHRGGAVVMRVSASATYTAPSFS